MKNIFQKNPSYNPTILQINFLFQTLFTITIYISNNYSNILK
nr:MAG TPA: hypothetical protein [Caudoviricetes sp.]DAN38298.1 MAG TPA: hypothetical protein [Caudoviricetes sp.]DAS13527.1 MAG TPA: hypothetical protein [Caudoviricetes sp.]